MKRCRSTRQSWQDAARWEFWGWVELVATVRSSLMSADASDNLQGTSSTPSQPGTTLDTPLLEIAQRGRSYPCMKGDRSKSSAPYQVNGEGRREVGLIASW